MALDPQAQMTETALVIVKNNAPTRFRAKYARQVYEIEPDATRMVPYHAAVTWFGDPRAVNKGSKHSTQFRQKECDRISVRYGLHGDSWRDPATDVLHENLPDIELFDLATNDKIVTIIEDPSGDHLTPDTSSIREQRDLEATVTHLQRQLTALEAQIEQTNPALAEKLHAQHSSPAPTVSDADIPDNLPSAPSDEDLVAQFTEAEPTPDPESKAKADTGTRRRRTVKREE